MPQQCPRSVWMSIRTNIRLWYSTTLQQLSQQSMLAICRHVCVWVTCQSPGWESGCAYIDHHGAWCFLPKTALLLLQSLWASPQVGVVVNGVWPRYVILRWWRAKISCFSVHYLRVEPGNEASSMCSTVRKMLLTLGNLWMTVALTYTERAHFMNRDQ